MTVPTPPQQSAEGRAIGGDLCETMETTLISIWQTNMTWNLSTHVQYFIMKAIHSLTMNKLNPTNNKQVTFFLEHIQHSIPLYSFQVALPDMDR